MTKTTERILKLMQEHNLNPHQLEVAAQLPNASIQAWVKGKKRKDGKISETSPAADSITNLARYFNVSADYLLCLTDEPTPLKQSDIAERPTTALSTELAELGKDQRFVDSAKLYGALSDTYKERVLGYLTGLAQGLGLNIQQILGK